MLRRLGLVVVLAATGCGALESYYQRPSDAVIPTSRPDRLYEEVFPRYVELCAASQFRPQNQAPPIPPTINGIF